MIITHLSQLHKNIIKGAGILALASAFTVVYAQPAAAFDPNRIIDDAVFTNKNSMSVNDIQNFLNSKVPTCDTWHAPGAGSQGNQPPWTCLKNYSEGGRSAAQIIYDAAQNYSINPQVILVTLQKENGLITDSWPYHWQYRTAMGMGCPDGAPCDSQYFGFANQVNQGTRHLKNYYDQNPNWFIPHRAGVNNVKFHPNAGCGTSQLNINRATSALYSYTPYQPNAAALANMYGTGDGCSSYGNRNFWRDFTNWFGSTYADESNTVNVNWLFETLSGDPGSVSTLDAATGQSPATISFNGVLHVFYYNSTSGNLEHAYEGGSGWQFEVLDGASTTGGRVNANVGKMAEVVSYNGNLHVFYYDETNGDLRRAFSDGNGTNWQFETVDGAGGANGRTTARVGVNPTATAYGAGLQLFYYDATHGNLRHAWIPTAADSWSFENLDGDPGSVGRANADIGEDPVAKTYNGTLQLFYYDMTHGNLRHAWADNRGWHFENLDGDPGSVGRHNTNLGITPTTVVMNNVLYTFYYDMTYGSLRSAYADSTGWHFATLDGPAFSVSRANSNLGVNPTATVHSNTLQLFYYELSYNNLRHAWGPQL